MNKLKSLLALALLSSLTACGGGGGGSTSTPPPVVSTETFQLKDAWINYFVNSGSTPFTISGTIDNVSVSGSGRSYHGELSSASFGGQQALAKSNTVTATLNANNQSIPINSTSTEYIDVNYNYLGSSTATEYLEVDTYATPISNAVKVNENGVLYTEKKFNKSNNFLIGTVQTSFVLEPDTAQSAILKLIKIEKLRSGTVSSESAITFRVTPTGSITRLYETSVSSDGNLKISY